MVYRFVYRNNLNKVLFTSGNGTYDGIKDDENLTNLYFNKFDKRCKMVLAELKKANQNVNG